MRSDDPSSSCELPARESRCSVRFETRSARSSALAPAEPSPQLSSRRARRWPVCASIELSVIAPSSPRGNPFKLSSSRRSVGENAIARHSSLRHGPSSIRPACIRSRLRAARVLHSSSITLSSCHRSVPTASPASPPSKNLSSSPPAVAFVASSKTGGGIAPTGSRLTSGSPERSCAMRRSMRDEEWASVPPCSSNSARRLRWSCNAVNSSNLITLVRVMSAYAMKCVSWSLLKTAPEARSMRPRLCVETRPVRARSCASKSDRHSCSSCREARCKKEFASVGDVDREVSSACGERPRCA